MEHTFKNFGLGKKHPLPPPPRLIFFHDILFPGIFLSTKNLKKPLAGTITSDGCILYFVGFKIIIN